MARLHSLLAGHSAHPLLLRTQREVDETVVLFKVTDNASGTYSWRFTSEHPDEAVSRLMLAALEDIERDMLSDIARDWDSE